MSLTTSILGKRKRNLVLKHRRNVLTLGLCFIVFLHITYRVSTSYFKSILHNSSKLTSNQTTSVAQTPTDDFCRKIIENPQPWDEHCERNMTTMSCQHNPDSFLMFSHHKQDWYFYTEHFKNLKRPGFYMDIATNEPVKLSNTFFFDRCLQWKGVCVEANNMYAHKIRKHRSCEFFPTCISKNDCEIVTFAKQYVKGGIIGSTYKFDGLHDKNTDTMEQLRCTNVSTILDKNRVQVVDFLSLDVEGHEMMTLQGIDWTKTHINVMSIETSFKEDEERRITAFLESKGYRLHTPKISEEFPKGRIGLDTVYLHKDVVFGNPV